MIAECQAISPYLTAARGSIELVEPRGNPPDGLPCPVHGTVLLDGGALIVADEDLHLFNGCPWLKRLINASAMLYNSKRHCLYLAGVPDEDIAKLPAVAERVELCRRNRKKMAEGKSCRSPKEFRDRVNPGFYAAVPAIVALKREYIPVALYGADDIPTFQIIAVPDADLFHCGILMSKMHFEWMFALGGRLKGDLRYSTNLCFNAFPWPQAGKAERQEVSALAQNVFNARRSHPDFNLDGIYDPKTMPQDVRKAHMELDAAVDRLYGGNRSESRIQTLLEEYSARKSKTIDRFF